MLADEVFAAHFYGTQIIVGGGEDEKMRVDDEIKRRRFFKQSPKVGADSHTNVKCSTQGVCFARKQLLWPGETLPFFLAHESRCGMVGLSRKSHRLRGLCLVTDCCALVVVL